MEKSVAIRKTGSGDTMTVWYFVMITAVAVWADEPLYKMNYLGVLSVSLSLSVCAPVVYA